MDYKVKDIKLAEQGNKQLEWAAMHMPALGLIREEFIKSKPFKGHRISAVASRYKGDRHTDAHTSCRWR